MSPLPGEVRKIPARKSVLSSQLALLDRFFLNDYLQMRGHIPVQPNRDGELAQRLERRWNETERPSNCLASSSACVFSLAERRTAAAFICSMTALFAAEASIASLRGRR